MNGLANDIDLIKLLFGLIILTIPFAFLYYYRIGLIGSSLFGILRMVVQLSLVAVYLEWIFNLNSAWINSLWVIIMIFVGVGTSIKRIGLNWRYFLMPLLLSWFFAAFVVDAFFLGWVLDLDYKFDAAYLVPITGMILGNSLNHNIISMNSYIKSLTTQTNMYEFLLINTGSKSTAVRSFIQTAIKDGLNPLIASISVIGLISLPGMMTGQILAGQSPLVAIKYQMMIMIAIYAASSTSLILSIIFSNYFLFDSFDNIKPNILVDKKTKLKK